MLNAILISDDDRDHDRVRRALEAAGCTGIERLRTEDVARLLCARVGKPDVVVAITHDPRLLNRLVTLDVPIVVICSEQRMDAAFLAGAAECVAFPVRARELEGRVRHALRIGGQSQFHRARERRMADMIADLQRAKSALEKQLCIPKTHSEAVELGRAPTSRHPLGTSLHADNQGPAAP